MFSKISIPKNFENFTGPVLESLFNTIAGLQSCNFIKKRLQHRHFPVKFARFLKTLFFLQDTPVAASGEWNSIFSKVTDYIFY